MGTATYEFKIVDFEPLDQTLQPWTKKTGKVLKKFFRMDGYHTDLKILSLVIDFQRLIEQISFVVFLSFNIKFYINLKLGF